MPTEHRLEDLTGPLRDLMRAKLGVRGRDFAVVLRRAERQLPRVLRAQGRMLADAAQTAAHPRLGLTLDWPALERASADLRDHLETIDLADRRKGWILSVLGSIAFNILAIVAILLTVLVWRGFL